MAGYKKHMCVTPPNIKSKETPFLLVLSPSTSSNKQNKQKSRIWKKSILTKHYFLPTLLEPAATYISLRLITEKKLISVSVALPSLLVRQLTLF